MSTAGLIETLEGRTLFAGASVQGTVLRVVGPPVAGATIDVNNSADGTAIDVSIAWTPEGGSPKTFTGSFEKSRGFTKINILGGNGNDTINVAQTNGSIGSLKVRVEAKQGNDTITLGDEQDAVYAGRGADVVHAGGGNDIVYGGLGNDQLFGEDGNDTLWGGRGQDSIDGGNGDDKLGGVLGAPNQLTGGAGQDTFVVRSLAANPSNDYNASEDILKTRPAAADDADAPDGVTA